MTQKEINQQILRLFALLGESAKLHTRKYRGEYSKLEELMKKKEE